MDIKYKCKKFIPPVKKNVARTVIPTNELNEITSNTNASDGNENNIFSKTLKEQILVTKDGASSKTHEVETEKNIGKVLYDSFNALIEDPNFLPIINSVSPENIDIDILSPEGMRKSYKKLDEGFDDHNVLNLDEELELNNDKNGNENRKNLDSLDLEENVPKSAIMDIRDGDFGFNYNFIDYLKEKGPIMFDNLSDDEDILLKEICELYPQK